MFTKAIGDGAYICRLEPRHAESLFALVDANRERLSEWLPWVDHTKTADDIGAFIRRVSMRWAEHGDVTVGVYCDGALAGVVGLDDVDTCNGTAEIGYWLGADFEGRGLVSATCRVLLQHAFEELALNRVQLCIEPCNERSKAVAKRLGFRYEGTLRQVSRLHGCLVDHDVHSLLKEEWQDSVGASE